MRISEAGSIGRDGKLRMPMDRLNEFFRCNAGMLVTAVFETADPASTEAQQGYYYNYVLPTVGKALYERGNRMTRDDIEDFLFGEYPGEPVRADGDRVNRGRDLGMGQMSDFLDWLKQYAAENLDTYIADPIK